MRYWWKHLIWCHSRVRTRFPLAERAGEGLAAGEDGRRAGGGSTGARGGRPAMAVVDGLEGGAALEGLRRIGREAKEIRLMAGGRLTWPGRVLPVRLVGGLVESVELSVLGVLAASHRAFGRRRRVRRRLCTGRGGPPRSWEHRQRGRGARGNRLG